MLGDRCHLDFETFAIVDIADVGGYAYANHWLTEMLCLQFALNHERPELLTPETVWSGHPSCHKLYQLAADPTVMFVAHNAAFEMDFWAAYMVPLGYPPLGPERWICTMAKCLVNSVPASLDHATWFLGLPDRKDMEGKKVMELLCKPRKPSKNDPRTRYTKAEFPQMYEVLYGYCAQDIEAERGVDRALPDLTEEERETWIIDQEINLTGLQLDIEAVIKANALIEEHKTRMVQQLQSRIGLNPTQRAKVQEWLKLRGVAVPNMQGPTLEGLLEGELEPLVREVIEIYTWANRSSLAKFRVMLLAWDRSGIIRRYLRHHGAHTGRWTSLLIQLQNMSRPTVSIPLAIKAIKALSYELFAWLYNDDPAEALASSVRGMIVAREGYTLMVGDQSQIEALTLAWLAGQETTLEAKRSGRDLYCAAGPGIFGREITKADHDARQTCKGAVLGSGFGGGINALGKTCKTYGISLAAVVMQIWNSTNYGERTEAERSVLLYNQRHAKDLERLPRAEALVADVIKQRWRIDNPHIETWWYELEWAAIEAVRTGLPVPCRRVLFFIDGNFLRCQLPSGRTLAYPFPRLVMGKRGKVTLYYRTSDKKKWKFNAGWVKTWGGTLAENITQAASRDLMVFSMKLLRRHGYRTLLTVHDELVCEVPIGFGSVDEFKGLMSVLPPWGGGVPLEIDAWTGPRYGKAA